MKPGVILGGPGPKIGFGARKLGVHDLDLAPLPIDHDANH